jgi:hypothetical protein
MYTNHVFLSQTRCYEAVVINAASSVQRSPTRNQSVSNQFPKAIHVIVSLFNPSGYESRYLRINQFAEYINKFTNAVLWIAEGAHPGQDFVATQADNPHHLQVQLDQWIWHKESLLNALAKRLPDDGNPIAWIDGDILFARPDWVEATLKALETNDIVQMFSECQELTDQYTLLKGNLRRGMVYAVQNGGHLHYDGPCAYPRPGPITTVIGHCGYAWAMTRDAWNKLDGLLDHAIVGSSDYQMATAWLGNVSATIPTGASEGYKKAIFDYQDKVKALKLKVGYVPGIALHLWHGKRKDRGFEWRDTILTRNAYNPATDLKHDANGIVRLVDDGSGRAAVMLEQIKNYFGSRKEDLTAE